MIKPLVLGFALSMALAAPRAASACTCFSSPEPKTDAQITREIAAEVRKAAAVFSGKVVARSPLTVTFLVDGVWKGTVSSRFEMSNGSVGNPDGTITMSSCDFSFQDGVTYVVFAYGTSPKTMHASHCTYTNAISFAPDTLTYLNRVSRRRLPQR